VPTHHTATVNLWEAAPHDQHCSLTPPRGLPAVAGSDWTDAPV